METYNLYAKKEGHLPLPFCLVFVHALIPLDLLGLFDCLLVQVVVDGQHGGRRFTLCAPVLLDELHHLRMERSLVTVFLGGEVVKHLRKAWVFSLVFCCQFGIMPGIVNLLVDEVSDLLNNFYIIPPSKAPESFRCLQGQMQSAQRWAA